MSFITMNYFSPSMARSVKVHVILPFDLNLAQTTEPYKTLYFLPGFSAGATDIGTSINLVQQATYKGIAVVIPDGENSFYVDQPDRKANYRQYVGKELVEVTRRLFPLSDKREDTFIGGISMGGFGSLMLGMLHVENFSKILAMSPATELYKLIHPDLFPQEFMDSIFGNEENYMKNYDPANLFIQAKQSNGEIPDLFLCSGRQDELVYEQDLRFVNTLKENKISVQYQEDDGGHDIIFWNKMLDSGVDFLLRGER
ncbi:MAG: alpha/beta hydrolase-fold protein [Neobacillus sp.]